MSFVKASVTYDSCESMTYTDQTSQKLNHKGKSGIGYQRPVNSKPSWLKNKLDKDKAKAGSKSFAPNQPRRNSTKVKSSWRKVQPKRDLSGQNIKSTFNRSHHIYAQTLTDSSTGKTIKVHGLLEGSWLMVKWFMVVLGVAFRGSKLWNCGRTNGLMSHTAQCVFVRVACVSFPAFVLLRESSDGAVVGLVRTSWTLGWSIRKGSGSGGRNRDNQPENQKVVATAQYGCRKGSDIGGRSMENEGNNRRLDAAAACAGECILVLWGKVTMGVSRVAGSGDPLLMYNDYEPMDPCDHDMVKWQA
ncbi:hypothetical protein F511_25890 [Dorcoceras hygrometricum]|uniref:Uncharacterized protein n=1 Tax=Dorcoceras hygrometricum TaxID=472368 RepID=A0A2Z7BXU4_9LAMI|nr:hypothetical protein F511_25890 [Dorcoceras hygrometricum]